MKLHQNIVEHLPKFKIEERASVHHEPRNMLPFLLSKSELLSIKKSSLTDRKLKGYNINIVNKNLDAAKPKYVYPNREKLFQKDTQLHCDCSVMHLTKIVIKYSPRVRKRGASDIILSMTTWGAIGQQKRVKFANVKLSKRNMTEKKHLTHKNEDFFKMLEVYFCCRVCNFNANN